MQHLLCLGLLLRCLNRRLRLLADDLRPITSLILGLHACAPLHLPPLPPLTSSFHVVWTRRMDSLVKITQLPGIYAPPPHVAAGIPQFWLYTPVSGSHRHADALAPVEFGRNGPVCLRREGGESEGVRQTLKSSNRRLMSSASSRSTGSWSITNLEDRASGGGFGASTSVCFHHTVEGGAGGCIAHGEGVAPHRHAGEMQGMPFGFCEPRGSSLLCLSLSFSLSSIICPAIFRDRQSCTQPLPRKACMGQGKECLTICSPWRSRTVQAQRRGLRPFVPSSAA